LVELCWSRVSNACNDNAILIDIISVAHPPNFSSIRVVPGLAHAAAGAVAGTTCCTSEHETAGIFAPSMSICYVARMLQFSAQSELSRVCVQVHQMLHQVQLGNYFGQTFCTVAFLVISRGYMQNFSMDGVSKCDLFMVAAPGTVICCSCRA